MTQVVRIGELIKKGAADTLRDLQQIGRDTCGRYLRTPAADVGTHLPQIPERGQHLPEEGCRNRGLFDYRTVVFAATTGLFLLLVTHTFEGDFGEHFEKKFSGNEANLGFLHH